MHGNGRSPYLTKVLPYIKGIINSSVTKYINPIVGDTSRSSTYINGLFQDHNMFSV